MNNINTFDPSRDPYELYPELKILLPKLKDDHMTTWALLYLYHPNSPIHNLDFPSALQTIQGDFYTNKKFNPDDYTTEISMLYQGTLSKPKRFLIEWETKLNERQEFMADLKYDFDTYEVLDKMMAATEKMWKQYMTCLKDVEDEEQRNFGGASESASEQGLI